MRDYRRLARSIIESANPWDDGDYETLEKSIAEGLEEIDTQTQKEITKALFAVLLPYLDVDEFKENLKKAVKLISE